MSERPAAARSPTRSRSRRRSRATCAVDAGAWDDLDDVFADGAIVDFSNNGGARHVPRDQGLPRAVALDLRRDPALHDELRHRRARRHRDRVALHARGDGVDRRRRRPAPRRRRLLRLHVRAHRPTAGASRSSSCRSSGSTANGPWACPGRGGGACRPTASARPHAPAPERTCTSASTSVAATRIAGSTSACVSPTGSAFESVWLPEHLSSPRPSWAHRTVTSRRPAHPALRRVRDARRASARSPSGSGSAPTSTTSACATRSSPRGAPSTS